MLMQANIGGFAGRPATVIGAVDAENQTLYIERADKLVGQRFQNAGLITNQPIGDYDYFFTEKDFKPAFQAYRLFQNSGRLIIQPQAQRVTPPLEVDKITESGTSFVISGNITNEQIAVIALCFFAAQCLQYQQSIDAYQTAATEFPPFFSI